MAVKTFRGFGQALAFADRKQKQGFSTTVARGVGGVGYRVIFTKRTRRRR